MSDVFAKVFSTIESRKQASENQSYVASLMQAGTKKINAKVTEEASEVCEASLKDDKDHLVYEITDLLFHSFVLAAHKGISLQEIEKEFERRHGTSGLEEKAKR